MRRFLGVLAVLVMVAAACDNDVETEVEEPILIGGVYGLSGLMEPFDGPPHNGAQVAIQQINDRGGVLGRPLELEVRDMESEPAEAATAAIELIEMGAVALIAPCDFDMAAPAGIEANNAGIPVISSCAASPLFGLEGVGEYAFTFSPGTHNGSAVMAEWAYQEQGWRSAYILADQFNEYTTSLQDFFTERWSELAGEDAIVGTDTFTFGDEDLSAQVTRIAARQEEIDFIWLPSFVPQTGTVIRQLRAQGVDVPVLGADAFDSGLLVEVGGENLSDVFYAAHGFIWEKGEDADTDAFIEAYVDRFGESPLNAYTLTGYDAIDAFARAIEAAGTTDGEAVKDALEAFRGEGFLTGATTFTPESHQPVRKPMAIVAVQNGDYTLEQWWEPQEVPEPQL